MKRATAQWLESAEMDLASIDQIIRREDLPPPTYYQIPNSTPLNVDVQILTDLDGLYIESRYPGEFGLLPNGKPTLADAQQFYDCARDIYEQMKRILEPNP